MELFLPQTDSNETLHIDFYGGEPLLAFAQVRFAMELITAACWQRNQTVEFTLTTNGSLLTEAMLAFFNRYRFHLILSFDGTAQEICRGQGTLDLMLETVERIKHYPGIQLEINSVFTPQTITKMAESVQFMVNYDLMDITLNICATEAWDAAGFEALKLELDKLDDLLVDYAQRNGVIPVSNFRSPGTGGIFHCSAGERQMAVAPNGELWGCVLFHDYFKNRKNDPQFRDYNLGHINDASDSRQGLPMERTANYLELRQNLFRSEEHHCFLCSSLEDCCVCPVNAAYTSGEIGLISSGKCTLNRIMAMARKQFHQHLREEKIAYAC